MTNSQRQWFKLIDQQERSGLSMAAFCKKKKLNKGTFSYYKTQRKKLRPKGSSPSFLPVVIDGGSIKPKMQLAFSGGVKLEFDEDVSPERLVAVVKLLRSAS